MEKRELILVIWLILISHSFFVLAQTPSPIPSPSPSNPTPKIEIIKQQNPNLGYLVEFSLPSFTEKKTLDEIYKNEIDKQYSEVTAKIVEIIAKKRGKSNIETKSKILKKSYKKVFNGVLLDITEEESKGIINIQGAKRVVPNREVSILLSESVPFIGANKVWGLDNEGKSCETSGKDCITGKGVKIAILDTGIDYTHPDLGNSIIEDRPFEKITKEPVKLFFEQRFGLDNDQTLSFDNKRLAYFSKNHIFIYSFITKETEQITIPQEVEQIIRLTMRDNIIVYAATDSQLEHPGIYYYDIDKKVHHKLSETSHIEIFRISNGKIIYQKLLSYDPPAYSFAMVAYDTATGEENTITTINEQSKYFFSAPVAADNHVVYITYKEGGTCYENAIIYDIATKERKEIHPPDIGAIFDMKDNKILYVACSGDNFDSSWSTYYLYDINTGEGIRLKTSNPSTGGNIQNNLISANVVGIKGSVIVRGWINNGRIENGVLFLNKDVNADKIVIYDLIKQRYALLNLLKYAGDFDSEGNKVCFMSTDHNIYCHDYDSTLAYELPKNIFNDKVVGGYDIYNNDNDPFDDHGHGTHVAGIVAGKGILKGVAPDAKLYAYKVMSIDGRGSEANVIEGIERAVDPNEDDDFSDKADIISMSLGGRGDPDDILSQAVDRAVDLGVNVVVSAGNSGPEGDLDCRHNMDDGSQNSICSPGTSRKAITVGATGHTPKGVITWGEGSSYGNPGLEKDSFHCIPPDIGNRCSELSPEVLSKIDDAISVAQQKGKKLIDKEGEPAEIGDFYILYAPDNPDKIEIAEMTYMPEFLTSNAFIVWKDFLTDKFYSYFLGADGEEAIFTGGNWFNIKVSLLKFNKVEEFSSRGPVIWQDSNAQQQILMKPDIVAPGSRICSARSSYTLEGNCIDGQHVAFSGTSMAAPHVTGVVALLKQKNPGLNPENIKNILKYNSIDLNLPENIQGSGQVSALESVFSGFIRGDVNRDRNVDLSDAIFLLDYLFNEGTEPSCFDSSDANDDGIVDISDAVRILLVLFGGETMASPYPNIGDDTTPDSLIC